MVVEETNRPFVKRALELDINFFDMANVYFNERSGEIIGKALHDSAASCDDVVIATKVYFDMNDKPGESLSSFDKDYQTN